MGHVRTRVTILNPTDSATMSEVEALVDTGATFTVVPRPLANTLKLPIIGQSVVRTATGPLTLDRACAEVRINGDSDTHSVLISDAMADVLVGVITLEALSLTVDPTSGQLKEAEALLILGRITMTNEVILAGAVRTPIGTFGGSFAETPATELGAVAVREALKRAGVKPEEVDEVIMGNVLSAGLGMNPARQAAIAAGIPDSVPATAINKVCGSGLKAVALATQAIILGDADVVVAGGYGGHVERALPAAEGPLRLPHGPRRGDRSHDQGRPLVRAGRLPHG